MSSITQEEFTEKFRSRWWRLNNLYWIQDKRGRRVKFNLNWGQRDLLAQLWFLNIILKARQIGFTTFICILGLDACLFNSNFEFGVIAHALKEAQKIFRKKIKYPYDNLPDFVKEAHPLENKTGSEFVFANGSSISVGVSYRSGTAQMLLVSEFGKICAKYPHKAEEIVTGAFQAVEAGQYIFIESTAEGRQGYFYDYCMEALKDLLEGRKLTELDFKFHFFPWWKHPTYRIGVEGVVFTKKDDEYFNEVETECKTTLEPEQRAWYIKKRKLLGEKMKQEYPSTPKESFEQSIQGAYFATQFQDIYSEGRITNVPVLKGVPVNTYWDLGMNDVTAIWFIQKHGLTVRLIDYYENSGEGLEHYAQELDKIAKERKFHYGEHFAPHDIEVRELGTGKSRFEVGGEYGIHFTTVPRVEKKADSIEAARKLLPTCWFDEAHTGDTGVPRLENYCKDWNDRAGVWSSKPKHDINSNGSDAFQTFALAEQEATHGAIPQSPKIERVGAWA
ncbi:phage terminase large subunit [Pseudodesulfovibrio nedwellii]|uniref:Phage terminase large subunit n=1 Tax=Pseudodesulfovibrio nedwellii TaxID=2973072 RepID=A0ABN6RY82_9BACT|nr:hypothetical protein [Pseudodesulfovibrio nedwellii]BDQ35921.1 phage terminase large subunit [Pseudodesulfovibrio nedwellii]